MIQWTIIAHLFWEKTKSELVTQKIKLFCLIWHIMYIVFGKCKNVIQFRQQTHTTKINTVLKKNKKAISKLEQNICQAFRLQNFKKFLAASTMVVLAEKSMTARLAVFGWKVSIAISQA